MIHYTALRLWTGTITSPPPSSHPRIIASKPTSSETFPKDFDPDEKFDEDEDSL